MEKEIISTKELKVGDKVKYIHQSNAPIKTDLTNVYEIGCIHGEGFYFKGNWELGDRCSAHGTSWYNSSVNLPNMVLIVEEKVSEKIKEKLFVYENIKDSFRIPLPVNKKTNEFVPHSEDFKNVNHIVENVSVAVERKIPVLLSGETGTGKTSLVRFLANRTHNGYRRVNHNGGTSVDDIVGKILVNKDGTFWVNGVLTEAMEKGYWYVADEINASSADILFIYHSLLDDDGYIVLAEKGGEIVKPHPNFRFFATMNPSADYHGVKELNKALMSRFLVIKTDFPTPAVEANILIERTGIVKEVAEKLVAFAVDLRASHAKDKIQFVLSTRDLLMWAEMYKVFGSYIKSAEISVLNKVGGEDFDVVKDLLSLNFKELDTKPTPKEDKKPKKRVAKKKK